MGNQHSHSGSGVETRQHHHHHHFRYFSSKYNISAANSNSNGHQVLGRTAHNSASEKGTSSTRTSTTTLIAKNQQKEELTTITTSSATEICICTSLNFTTSEAQKSNSVCSVDGSEQKQEQQHENNYVASPPSYELVKIGTSKTSIKRHSLASSQRISYSWRKIPHEPQNKLKQQVHHPSCPHFTQPPPPTHTSKSSLSGEQIIISMNALDKFCKYLVRVSNANGQISKAAFQKYVFPHCQILGEYVWNYLNGYTGSKDLNNGVVAMMTISEQKFFHAADKIYSFITDKDQIQFWFKVFAKGRDHVDRDDFKMFLLCAYQLSTTKINTLVKDISHTDKLDGREWIEAVTKSCFHIKDEMSVIFLCNWTANNLPRLLIPLHKYVVHQLTTGCSQQNPNNTESPDSPHTPKSSRPSPDSADNTKRDSGEKPYTVFNEDKFGTVSTINSVLLWLLSCSLPNKFISSLIKKTEIKKNQLANVTPKQFILQLLNNASEPDSWTLLYDSDEHGSSVNRFQFHVFHYRGPTLMIINAENGYKICLACDVEWKESCHFWGSEDSSILQLQPEFRLVERGKNIMYANFSIRGYPFGIQAGKDPKNVTVEINPDFQYISFKKIPCKIESILVYGCALSQAIVSQNEYKKWEAKECEKQKKVNLNPGSWNDNPDKYLLELAGSYQDYGHGHKQ